MRPVKKMLLTISWWLVAGGLTSAQNNLVPNPDFELMASCPSNIGQLSKAQSWMVAQCTPDYFNACDITPNNVSVPSNAFGSQPAHSGVAYAGFYTFNKSVFNGGRECIEVMLSNPLILGKAYLVSFYVSLGDNLQYSTNTIGAYFSSTQVTSSNCNRLNLIPQIQNTTANTLTDKNNWMLISDTLYPNGGEQYMTIGNFMPDSLSDTLYLGGGFNSSYYYIDDVSVIDVAEIGIEKNEDYVFLNIYPNPANEIITVELKNKSKSENCELVITDVIGNEIIKLQVKSKQEINVSGLNEGIYFIRIKTHDGFATKKIVVQH